MSARPWIALPAAGLAVLLAVSACARHEPPPDPVRPVQLQQVTTAPVADLAVFAGDIRPRHEADLAFRIGGKLVARLVDTGARVRKGQVLARLDPSDVGLQEQAAIAAMAAAETEQRFAQAEFDRYQNLFAQKFVSASALDQKRNALDTARAKLTQARAQRDVVRNQAAYATLVADTDGVVTSIAAEPGQVVAAGQTVLRIAREDEREVAIAVPEQRLAELTDAAGLFVVLLSKRDRPYAARVREVAPAVDPVTRTFAVRISVLDPDAALQWGMTVNVGVQGRARGKGTLLPLTALYREGDRPAVWIYDPTAQTVGLRPVQVAQYREDGVLISDGVTTGEWVVTAGVHKLQQGQKVRPYDPDKAASSHMRGAARAAQRG